MVRLAAGVVRLVVDFEKFRGFDQAANSRGRLAASIAHLSHLFRIVTAAAHQGGPGGAVVRLAEGAVRPTVQWGVAGHRVDGGDFQCLLLLQGRQQAGQAAGEQRLAGAGRPGEQQIVGTGGGHQQGALGGHLALYFGEVRVGVGAVRQAGGGIGFEGRLPGEVRGQFQQVADGDHPQAAGEAGFFGIVLRHHQGAPCRAGGKGSGEDALDRAQRAGEGQLTEAFHLGQAGDRHLAAGGEDAEGHGQVETPAVLGQVGRRQVQGGGKCHIRDEQGTHIVRTLLLG